MKIQYPMIADVELTPRQLAEAWCEMDSNEQAEFFNQICVVVEEGGRSLSFQLQHIVDSHCLDQCGRYLMEKIGEYARAKRGYE